MAPLTVELAPGIHRVPTAPRAAVNSFLFEEPDGSLTLLDAGLKRAPKRLLRAIGSLGKTPADVRRIVLTHAHADHAGGARRMVRESGARLLAHDDDAGYLRGGQIPPRDPRSITARILGFLPGGDFDAVEVDETVSDGQLLDVAGGLRVVHTPGHTPGHISLLHEGSGTLVTGDALFNWIGITFSVRFFNHDIEMSKETAWRLGDLDYEVAAFTHGPEIRDRARERIKDFLVRKLHDRT